jgi:hypothetical protein
MHDRSTSERAAESSERTSKGQLGIGVGQVERLLGQRPDMLLLTRGEAGNTSGKCTASRIAHTSS